MAAWWGHLLDVTVPITSWSSGARFNRFIQDVFGEETSIENLWLPFFAVSTDITENCSRVHMLGKHECLNRAVLQFFFSQFEECQGYVSS
jgi:lysophospholipid hydrolase